MRGGPELDELVDHGSDELGFLGFGQNVEILNSFCFRVFIAEFCYLKIKTIVL